MSNLGTNRDSWLVVRGPGRRAASRHDFFMDQLKHGVSEVYKLLAISR